MTIAWVRAVGLEMATWFGVVLAVIMLLSILASLAAWAGVLAAQLTGRPSWRQRRARRRFTREAHAEALERIRAKQARRDHIRPVP